MNALSRHRSQTITADAVARVRRESLRWRCLVALEQARPSLMSSAALHAVLAQTYPDIDDIELRRCLDYLELKGLLALDRKPSHWAPRLTYQGIDFVEYASDALPGIQRPFLE